MALYLVLPAMACADTPPPFPSLTDECISDTLAGEHPDFRRCATLSAYECAKGDPILICFGRELEQWNAAVSARTSKIREYATELETDWPMLEQLDASIAAWEPYLQAHCRLAGRMMIGGSGEQQQEAECLIYQMADRMNALGSL